MKKRIASILNMLLLLILVEHGCAFENVAPLAKKISINTGKF